MGNIHTVFEAVVDNATDGSGRTVRITVADRNEYETIRTRLVKFWTDRKTVITAVGLDDGDPTIGLSLCGDYDEESNRATFYLGKPRRKQAKQYSFEIVDAGATPDPAQAEDSVTIPDSANDELPDPTSKTA